MGLGKTLQAIAIAAHYRQDWPMLVVCPASMKYTWASELEKWLPELEPGEVNMIKTRNDCGNLGCPVSICSYGLWVNNSPLVEAILKQQFEVVVVDESHYLKNATTLRSKLLEPVLDGAKRTILLSGTPALARPVELYSQVRPLAPKLFGKYNDYCKRYCNAHLNQWGRWDVRGATLQNLPELHRKLNQVLFAVFLVGKT